MKKVLFDILHPGHLHFFNKTFEKLKYKNIEPIICTRNKEITIQLADEMKLKHFILSSKPQSSCLLPLEAMQRWSNLSKIIRAQKPILLVGVMGVFVAPIGKKFKIPSLVFYDTETATLTNFLTFLLASRVCVPTCYQGFTFKNTIHYNSYQTFAALYERVQLKKRINIDTAQEPIFVFRFVSRESSHEFFETSVSWKIRINWVNALKNIGKIIISSEESLPEELRPYQWSGGFSDFHQLLENANFVFSESATVCSEAACLGVRSFYLSDSKRGYLGELEAKYKLIQSIPDFRRGTFADELKRGMILESFNPYFENNYKKLLEDKIDPNSFILEQICSLC